MNERLSIQNVLSYNALPTRVWGLSVGMFALAAFTWLAVTVASIPEAAGWVAIAAGILAFVVIFVPAALTQVNGKTVSRRLVAWHYSAFVFLGIAMLLLVAGLHLILIATVVGVAQFAYTAGLTIWVVSRR
jgi:hypothetical protein